MSTILPTDLFLVQRGDDLYSLPVTAKSIEDSILPTDLLLVNRGNLNYKMTGADLDASLPITNGIYPVVPPFTLESETSIQLSNTDSKIEFSLDKTSWSSSLSVPVDTVFSVRWTTDIDGIAQDATYSSSIGVVYTLMGTSQTVGMQINSVNRVPLPFTIDPISEVGIGEVVEATPLFPQGYNTPSWVWGNTDGTNPQIRIAGSGAWIGLPSVPNDIRVGPNEQIQLRHTTKAGTQMTTTTNIFFGYGTGIGENQSYPFVTTNKTSEVVTPSIDLPDDGATGQLANPELVGSVYSGTGGAQSQKSASWQVSTTSDFTGVVAESLNDTTNLASWVVTPSLDWSTTYYCRVKYIGTDNTTSDWSAASSFTTVDALPPLVNGSYQWTTYSAPDNWTVPDRIVRVKAHLEGRKVGPAAGGRYVNGGIVEVEFDVVPGEIFRLGARNPSSISLLLAENTPDPDDPTAGPITQANIFAVVGEAGGYASSAQGGDGAVSHPGQWGGDGGGDQGDPGSSSAVDGCIGGGGGSQTAGGSIGGYSSCAPYGSGSSCLNPGADAAVGGPLQGGQGAWYITGEYANSSSEQRNSGGTGGSGWWGGGGGNTGSSTQGGAGGGGSSKIQVPASRNPTTIENTKGTGNGTPYPYSYSPYYSYITITY